MPNLNAYPDAWVLLHPSAAYRRLAGDHPGTSPWHLLRRPLLQAFVVGCAISLMTSGRLTLRLAVPTTLYWTFVPLCEIASLALVWSLSRPKISFPQAIDLFFMGQAPWSLVLIAYAYLWAFLPPVALFGQMSNSWYLIGPGLSAIAWSGFIGFHFFRLVLGRPPGAALGQLVLQRLICWTAVLACFLASSGWQVVATRFGL